MSLSAELPMDIKFLCEWTHDFEKLLTDKVGIRLFAEFLKKEYSYENLKFWISCQKYKRLTNNNEMRRQAMNIYNKYLSTDASEAVNVDSHARLVVEESLKNPTQQIFALAERQIFELMKFDCYKRFLKSVYSNNMIDSAFHERILDKRNRSQVTREKELTASRVRKRAFKKLKKLEHKEVDRKMISKYHARTRGMSTSNGNHSHLKVMSDSRELINGPKSSHSNKDKFRILKVAFPDGSQEKVTLTQNEKISQLLQKLINNKKLNYTAFDAFVIGSEKQLDRNTDVMKLECNEIRVEQRITFRLNFPNGIIVNIKTKPLKLCGRVFNSLLNKYGYEPEDYEIIFADSSKRVTPETLIYLIDNQSLIASKKEDDEQLGSDDNINALNRTQDLEFDNEITIINGSIFSHKTVENFSNYSNELLAKENYHPIKNLNNEERNSDNKSLGLKKKCINYFNVSDISFSDENKSEAFFNDIMISSQMMPINQNTFSLSPQPLSKKQIFQYKTDAKITQSEEIKSNFNVKSCKNFKQISNNIKFKDNESSSVSKPVDPSESKAVMNQKSLLETRENTRHRTMRTLAKFHKTSNEKLVFEPKILERSSEISHLFDFNQINVKTNHCIEI